MQTLTLCEKCRALFAVSYSVKPPGWDSEQPKPAKKCDKCKKQYRDLKVYVIDRKQGST